MKIVNRKARYEYNILEEVEAGMVLTGAEVKALRNGRGTLKNTFARISEGEVWLHNFVIPAYEQADSRDYDSTRPRKLLLHREQILAWQQKIQGKRLTIVPLVCYTTGRFVKVKLGLGKGKKEYEKREAIRRRDLAREAERALKVRK